ncbi:sulfotransferase domain-containing protein [Ichthyenterobacterium sp. W332]|uniref:Sulfotransferase domain-containing protein n=1 Tax=Microcosmobacter mediterraneus TaxID=3075607 RepID=A0ABU2YMJ2_9FLAO|nr:sulfotransferase domain-containing protein [Ichthyenterobacterium sp. W332]MDT0559385.1 sulfotransferase domain-containing protein [Ichthyenterobacterium sp. W332]
MKYFFITSIGRSGTAFFANLLNKAQGVKCFHEPYRQDYANLPLAYYSNDLMTLKDRLSERFRLINSKVSLNDFAIYGEVNSLLRYNTQWLKKSLNAKIVHVVRDPRKVVPSIYSRNVYKDGSSHLEIIPKNDDKFSKQWKNMDRFDKICWYWTHTNNMLLNDVDQCFRFEDLIANYDVFAEMCRYIEIPEISKKAWQMEIAKPKNTSKYALFRKRLKLLVTFKSIKIEDIGDFEQWSPDMKIRFKTICGETAQKCGYDI